MTKIKKHRFYHNWTFGGFLTGALFIILYCSFIPYIIFSIVNHPRKSNSFTSNDLEYMINYIETNYGKGKEFILFNKKSKPITKRVKSGCINEYEVDCYIDKYIGEQAQIIGNFEGEKKAYFVIFERYYTDSPYKSGNNVIIHTYTNDNYNIDEYK